MGHCSCNSACCDSSCRFRVSEGPGSACGWHQECDATSCVQSKLRYRDTSIIHNILRYYLFPCLMQQNSNPSYTFHSRDHMNRTLGCAPHSQGHIHECCSALQCYGDLSSRIHDVKTTLKLRALPKVLPSFWRNFLLRHRSDSKRITISPRTHRNLTKRDTLLQFLARFSKTPRSSLLFFQK